MPPRAALATPLRTWQCPQCTASRAFTTTPSRAAVGPEHPRYITVPEPPQQTVPDRPFPKGRLPVPRDVFSGARGQDKASDEWLAAHTCAPQKPVSAPTGSREEWRHHMAEMRRRNLREGLAGLRTRQQHQVQSRAQASRKRQADREALLHAPERAEDRVTAPSHGLDFDALARADRDISHGGDPAAQSSRTAHKQLMLAAHESARREGRLAALQTLYLRARHFIVTPGQLDDAIDEAFGTPEQPMTFGDASGLYGRSENQASVWAYGRPEKVQDLLNRANKQASKNALEDAAGFGALNRDRVRKIAEVLTGGGMEEGEEARR